MKTPSQLKDEEFAQLLNLGPGSFCTCGHLMANHSLQRPVGHCLGEGCTCGRATTDRSR